MAEESQGQEKTEEATPRKREKARSEGQIARSKELNTMGILISGSVGLLVYSEQMMTSWFDLTRQIYTYHAPDPQHMFTILEWALYQAVVAASPIMVITFLAGIIASGALGGFVFSSKSIAFKANRMSPMKGFKRMFSGQSLVELLKAVFKILLVGGFAIAILMAWTDDLLSLGRQSLHSEVAEGVSIVGWTLLILSLSLTVIAFIDVPFQLAQFSKQMKMTRQEVKDEMKDSEGRPEVKGRIRQLQQEMSRARTLDNVPEADLIITNPDHYSVAIKYDAESSSAPLVVAKGADLMAFKIREIAQSHNVPIVQSPPLARAVYHSTEVGDEIPAGLYVAVAQVLAYVYQLARYKSGLASKPELSASVPIPEEYAQDE
ncbi:MAG: flagellar biosynthesis protein FlhB [Pseudomonadales bacterium]|nr:flagellar biosynthesis protein FlhB [Pseudomonadales bacterium]